MINRTQEEIMQNWGVDNTDTPLVSIRCITYNHEPYIAQALDGFLMQKTTFPFEVVVHDDASTDKTADIIREYEKKYPKIVKPIYETENQYSKHDGSLGRIMNANCKGIYYAMCEGDDYWIDDKKLQIQIKYLEDNKDCIITCSNRLILLRDNKLQRTRFDFRHKYYLGDVEAGYIPCTASMVVRNYSSIIDDLCKYVGFFSGDRLLTYLLLKNNNNSYIYRFSKNFVVHRNQGQGIWSGFQKKEQRERKIFLFIKFRQLVQFQKNAKYVNHLYFLAMTNSLNVSMVKKSLFQDDINFSYIKYGFNLIKIFFSKILTLLMVIIDKCFPVKK